MTPGRSCPVHYRYRADAIAAAGATEASVLYVIGGLYGNTEALSTILALSAHETATATLCFNGDFNWFNVASSEFERVNQTVLQYDALRGNVETEISDDSTAGDCGCAYPEWVDKEVVERSNLIITKLKKTASSYTETTRQLASLPMFRRYQLADTTVAVVHGDCESLSGWGLAQETIDNPAQQQQVNQWADQANCQVIASTHTCLPFLYRSKTVQVINNGAAGMPNFQGTHFGCITRLATVPRPDSVESLYGHHTQHIYIDAVPIHYDHTQWIDTFRKQWSADSPAYLSYYDRLQGELSYALTDAQRVA